MDLLWTGWAPIAHTAVVGTVGYLALVLLLRLSGARTMATMTPLDFVVAVTLGSAFGRTVTAVEVPASQAVAALLLLVGLQWLLAAVRYRGGWLRRAVDAPPVLLWYDGAMLPESLRRHRLTEADVHTAARQAGHGSLEPLKAVILQQDGSLGVMTAEGMGDGSTVLPYVERTS